MFHKAKIAVLTLLSAIAGRSQSESSDDSSFGNNGFITALESCDCLPLPWPFESAEEDLGRALVLLCFSLCSFLAFSKAPLWPFGLSPLFLESTALYVLGNQVSFGHWLHIRSNPAQTSTSACWNWAIDHRRCPCQNHWTSTQRHLPANGLIDVFCPLRCWFETVVCWRLCFLYEYFL